MKALPAAALATALVLSALAAPGVSSAFDEADDNHDGKLTPDEFIKAESLSNRRQAGDYLSDAEITA